MIDNVSFLSAALSGSGIVVNGTITGTAAGKGEVQVEVTQGHGKGSAKGSSAIGGPELCTGSPVPWTVTVNPREGAFTAGEIILVIRGNSFNEKLTFDGGTHIRVTSTV